MKPTLERILGQRVREVAAARKLPLSHVADRAGVSRSYMWAILRGTSSATLEMVQRLAAVLEVPPGSLLMLTSDHADVSKQAASASGVRAAANPATKNRRQSKRRGGGGRIG